MNLPALFRRALQVLFPAMSPQQTTEPARGVAPAPVRPARDWDDENDPANKTRWIPVGQARARIRDRVDQFPARPAEPKVRRRVRGTAEVKTRREFPDNTAPDRWTP